MTTNIIRIRPKTAKQRVSSLQVSLLSMLLLCVLYPAHSAAQEQQYAPGENIAEASRIAYETGLSERMISASQMYARDYYRRRGGLADSRQYLQDITADLATGVNNCDRGVYRKAGEALRFQLRGLRDLYSAFTRNYSRINQKYNDMHAEFEQTAKRPLIISGPEAPVAGAGVSVIARIIDLNRAPGARFCPTVSAALSLGAVINLAGATYDAIEMLRSKDVALELLRLKLEYERHLIPGLQRLIADAERTEQHFAGLFDEQACTSTQCVQESGSDRLSREARDRERAAYLRQKEREIEADRRRMQERLRQSNENW